MGSPVLKTTKQRIEINIFFKYGWVWLMIRHNDKIFHVI